jgi:hypothetical protein
VDSPTPRTEEEKGAMVERFASIAWLFYSESNLFASHLPRGTWISNVDDLPSMDHARKLFQAFDQSYRRKCAQIPSDQGVQGSRIPWNIATDQLGDDHDWFALRSNNNIVTCRVRYRQ